jgi:hypothetical protein
MFYLYVLFVLHVHLNALRLIVKQLCAKFETAPSKYSAVH